MISRIVLSALLTVPLLVPASPSAAAQDDPLIAHRTSWLGETISPEDAAFFDADESGWPGYGRRWVQTRVMAMWVDPLSTDGLVYTNSPYDEASRNMGVYEFADNTARPVAELYPQGSGGTSVTGDEKYVYADFTKGTTQLVVRYDRGVYWYGDTIKMSVFPGGEPVQSEWKAGRSLTGKPGGMTTGQKFLYVSRPEENLIYVYEREGMTVVAKHPATNPGALAFRHETNTLFALTDDASGHRVVRTWSAGASGGLTAGPVITDTGVQPVALAANSSRLLVADNDISTQQVRFYQDCPTCAQGYRLQEVFGEPGGMVGAHGRYDDDRFDNIAAVGIAAGGAFYVASNSRGEYGSLDIRQFVRGHALAARLVNHVFLDVAVPDPRDPTDVFTAYQRYKLNYATTTPGAEWDPRQAQVTMDRATCPHDPRTPGLAGQSQAVAVRHLTGGNGRQQTFLYVRTAGSGYADLGIYRVTDDGIRPSVLFSENVNPWPDGQPPMPGHRSRWTDSDADCVIDPGERVEMTGYVSWVSYAHAIDLHGGVWGALGARVHHFPVVSFDGAGNPEYGPARLIDPPALPMDAILGMQYDDATDTMYLYGYRGAAPNATASPRYILARYDRFGTDQRTLAWSVDMNYTRCWYEVFKIDACVPFSMALAGDRVYVADSGAGPDDPAGKVRVFRSDSGAYAGHLAAGPEVAHAAGWVDVAVSGITATRLPSGEHVIFREEDFLGRVLMYRYTPAH